MNRILIALLLLCTTWSTLSAQNPKWYKKARKAQFTFITYDAAGRPLARGGGFFLGADGTAVADYAAFKGAARATVTTAEGHQAEVHCISGASSLYDVVKFRVDVSGLKKVHTLPRADRPATSGEVVTVLPHPAGKKDVCRIDTVLKAETFEAHHTYYTLSRPASDSLPGHPVMNAEGHVLGLTQRAAAGGAAHSFALSLSFADSLTIRALSASDADLQAIGIRKALPADEAQASTFIYLTSATADTAAYRAYLDEFVRLFPQSATGYVSRIEHLAALGRHAEAEAAYTQGLEAAAAKDEVRYALAKAIYGTATQSPDTTSATWNLGRALTEVETAYAENPLPLYTSLQAHCLYALKRYGEAADKFLALTATNMRSAQNFLFASQCRRMQQAPLEEVLALQDSAVACFTRPYVQEAASVLMVRAVTRMEAGRYRDAVADFNDYEHLMAGRVGANFYYQREQAEVRCRMYQQALDDIDRAIALTPDNALFHAEKASLHYRVGQNAEAIAAAREALRLEEEFADAHRLLGICLLHDGRKDEAVTHLQRAVALGDESARKLLSEGLE